MYLADQHDQVERTTQQRRTDTPAQMTQHAATEDLADSERNPKRSPRTPLSVVAGRGTIENLCETLSAPTAERSPYATGTAPSVCDTPTEHCDTDHDQPWNQHIICQDNGRIQCPPHNHHHDLHHKPPQPSQFHTQRPPRGWIPDTNLPDTNLPDTNLPDTNLPDTNRGTTPNDDDPHDAS